MILKSVTFDMKSIIKCCSVLIFLTFIECIEEPSEEDVLIHKLGFGNSSIIRTLIPPVLGPKYNRNNEPVNVTVDMFISNIENIDEKNLEMKVQMTLRMSWVDPRISYLDLISEENVRPFGSVKLTDISKIWIPDVFFPNEKQAHEHNLIGPNAFIRIYPNGKVSFSKRISLTLGCMMDLEHFPHDSQMCPIRLGTYQTTNEYVVLLWKWENPVQLPRNFQTSRFTLRTFKTSESVFKTTTGNYSHLQAKFIFDREFFYYFKKFYAPVVIVVLISWIPFWLERVLILRIYIAWSTVVFLGWFCTAQDTDLLIFDFTGLDAWNAANFITVFLAALESMLVVFMIKTNSNMMKRTHPDDNDEFKMLSYGPDKRTVLEITDEKTLLDAEIMKIKTNFKICFINVHKEVQIIDAAAKIFFPSAYMLYLFFYWITYSPIKPHKKLST